MKSSLKLSAASLLCCAAALTATATLARADIIRCVDRAGHVTLTDAGCPAGSSGDVLQAGGRARAADEDTITIDRLPADTSQSADNGSDGADTGVLLTTASTATAAPARAIERMSYQAGELPPPARVIPMPARRTVTLDASTLQQAHETMLMMDNANRQHKLVASRW